MMGTKVIIQLAASVLISGLSFLTLALSARLFGPEIFGQVAYLTGILGLAFAFTDLGLSRAHVHLTAVRGRPEIATFLSLKLPLLLMAAMAVLVVFRRQELPSALAILIIVEIFSRLADSLLISFEGKEQAWPQNLLKIGAKSLRLVAVLFLGWKMTDSLGYSLTFMAEAAVLFSGSVILGRNWFRYRPSRELIQKYIRYSLPFAVIIPLSYIQDSGLTLLLQHYQGAVILGIYTAGFGLFGFLKTLSSSLMIFFFPRISRLFQENNLEKIQIYSDMAVKILLWILVPLVVLLMILSRLLVPAILGTDFIAAVPIFQIYLLGILILAVFTPYHHVMFATNNQGNLVKVNIFTTVFGLGLAWWLIPVLGGKGAAWVSVISWLIGGCWQFLILKQKIGIKFLRNWRLSKVEVKYLYGLIYSFSQAVFRPGRKK